MLSKGLVAIMSPVGFVGIIHFFVNVMLFTYILYAFIIVRQVKSLNSGLKTDGAFLFAVLSYAHLLAAIILFIYSAILI